MAETVDYKVNIDASDLSNQLQNIKNQIDQAMAMYSFNTTTPLLSTSPQFPLGEQLGQATDTGAGMALGSLHNMIQSSRLGMQKLTQDMQNIALSTPVTFPAFHPSNVSWQPQFAGGMLSNGFEALTGWGYDPHMSTTRGGYQRKAGRLFEDEFAVGLGNFAAGGVGSVVGGALGSLVAPGIGTFVGGLVGGMVGEGAAGFLDFNAASNVRAFTRDTSWRFLSGEFSPAEATKIGNIASTMARSPELVGYRVSPGDIQSSIKAFTEAGGFDFSRSADEFADKMKTVVVAIEKVKQTLQVSKDEAARIIADLQLMGVPMTTNAINDASIGIKALASATGYRAGEMMEFGGRVSELVRGTGVDLGSAYFGGMNLLGNVRGLMANGTFSPQLMAQLGGAENTAMTMARQGYEYMSGMGGFVTLSAMTNYGPGTSYLMDPYQRMIGGVAGASSVGKFLELRGAQSDMVSMLGPEKSYQMFAGSMLSEAEWYANSMGADLNRNTFRSIMQMTRGLSAPQADALLNYNLQTHTNVLANTFAQNARERADQIPGPLDTAIDVAENALSSFVNRPSGPRAISLNDMYQRTAGEFRDFGRSMGNLFSLGTTTTYIDDPTRGTNNADVWKSYGKRLNDYMPAPNTYVAKKGLKDIATLAAADENYALFVEKAGYKGFADMAKEAHGDKDKLAYMIEMQLKEGNEDAQKGLANAPITSEWKRIGVTNAQAFTTIGTSMATGAAVGGTLGAVVGGLLGWGSAVQNAEKADKARADQRMDIESGKTAELIKETQQLEAFSKEAQRKWGTTLSVTNEEQRKQLETLRSVVGGRTEKDILQSMAALMAGNGIRVIDVTPGKDKNK